MKASNNHLLAFVFFVWCIFSFTAALGAASIFFTSGTADLTNQLDSSWIFPLVFLSGLVCDLATNVATAIYLRSEAPTEAVECALLLLINMHGLTVCAVPWGASPVCSS